jgi:glycosyltransferase involved in cell wall biosynthesis
MTVDAIGGVWRYALDVARGLEAYGVTCLLVGFGPEPNAAHRAEVPANSQVVWTDAPLDWMVVEEAALHPGQARLAALARDWDADIIHLNLPSQAVELASKVPIVVASHSCVPTWWEAVRGSNLPADWAWQQERNRQGLRQADAVIVPSHSHAAALSRIYGPLPRLHVVYNGIATPPASQAKEQFVLSAGRWWDPGKNADALDIAAETLPWPVVLAGPLEGPNGQTADLHNVQTLGALPHNDVLGLMRRSSIFAAPSRYEPFGLAVAEAANCGAALVLSDIPTFRELWDGAALFVEPGKSWSPTLAALIEDAGRRRQLAALASSRACQYAVSRQAARMHELYADLGVTATL